MDFPNCSLEIMEQKELQTVFVGSAFDQGSDLVNGLGPQDPADGEAQ